MSSAQSNQNDATPSTIFVVDDEPMLLDLAMTVLEPLGFKVLTFGDPRKALAEYSTAKPVVVVTDYAMGEMNGLDLLRECRRINPQQKIVLLSGTVDENIFANAPVKPDRFLAKPYQIRDFVESILALAKA